MSFNDLDLAQWKSCDIDTNSLWLIKERDKSGKHKNIYHGNFIPQIPYQLIKRYTKANQAVFEPFMGSGTTLFECENLNRKYIGFDINPKIVEYVSQNMGDSNFNDYFIANCNSLDSKMFNKNFILATQKLGINSVNFVLMHPPYMDIIKFTDDKNDLSQCDNIQDFMVKFKIICQNSLKILEKNCYFALVIGDVYKNSEVLPLSFYTMDMIKRNFKVKLKGVVVKNIEGNREKLNSSRIWRYRALKSDYYIFKHEYIFVFKKEF
ncbi:DNA adenine methylase [Campylobacter sp. faydin G-24]|uniref:Methyltransferase n=2 Tax=Campylobacter anatolicus TaxID=2829105 RepID=A0ABS5HJZ3_9BACT|nr:DNA methyltransferase [Campylobacter anatolicus]MBR8464458.1 DNA adenine methylase [Campylobacter anatolicus]